MKSLLIIVSSMLSTQLACAYNEKKSESPVAPIEKQQKTQAKTKKTEKSSRASSSENSTRKTLAEVQTTYKNVKTLTAEFTQQLKNIALGTTKESFGRIFIKRPDMFRWETHKPEQSILVSNGKKVWYYTAPFREDEKGQVMTKRAADVQSRLAIDLLAGTINTEKDFKVRRLSDDHLELTPLKPAGDIDRVELYIEKPTKLVYKLVLYTKSGNQTALTLKNVTLGPSLSDTMFNFVPPANTEEIQ